MRKAVLFAFLFLFLLIFLDLATAPITPRNIKGTVFHVNGSGAENGLPVRINDTTTGTIVWTEVFAPPVPSLAGAYSATIDSDTGHNITVHSWNATHYGVGYGTIAGATTTINVTLNNTRVAEPDIQITYPSNNSLIDSSYSFLITANMTVLGSGGSCNVTLVTNESILNVTQGESIQKNLGFIQRDQEVTMNWSVQGQMNGVVNITLLAQCEGQGEFFETDGMDTVYNISLQDLSAPFVNIVSPQNDTLNRTGTRIAFRYTVNDVSSVNCSLIVNGTEENATTNAPKNTTTEFFLTLQNGAYDWNISCIDQYAQQGIDTGRNLTISYFPPQVNITYLTQAIVLNPGTTRRIYCNVSITDGDGYTDIVAFNTTVFHETETASSNDNPNRKYSNSTCLDTGTSPLSVNRTCSFDIQHFAYNGTWTCNTTVVDTAGLSDTDINTTTIDPLYALNISPDLINYGAIEAGYFSPISTINVSNIGNNNITVSVYGYGATSSDPYSFSCPSVNIPINNTHFAGNSSATFDQMQELGTTRQVIAGLLVEKQESIGVSSINSTYWQVLVPKNTSDVGECVGSVIFHAEASP